MRTRLLTLLLAAAAALPAAACASTVSLDGNTLVLRAAPGEKNWLVVGRDDYDAGHILLSDVAQPTAYPSTCVAWEYSSFVSCETPPGGVRLEAGDGMDTLDAQDDLPAGLTVALDGGSGNDVLRGAPYTATSTTMLGGEGNDKITGGQGADSIDGGTGDDEVDGRDGPDVVRGGDGNDKLLADYWDEQSTDVVDGGPGFDQISNNWVSASGNYQPPIVVSIDGVANDGRPGENDNVTNVESVYLNAPATLTGSDGPDEFTTFNDDAGSTYDGRGGDDKITAFDLDDTIDGGAGNDTIAGGYGNDTITGGPGRDTINGDSNGAICGYTQCRNPYGNDHIDARDGEADNVTCGVGEDVVEADAIDTVAPDCETVRRGAGGSAGDQQSTGGPAPASLNGVRAVRRGARLVVSGRATGATAVKVAVQRGRRTVSRGRAAVRSGRFTVRVRAPRRVTVTVTAGSAKRTLRVR